MPCLAISIRFHDGRYHGWPEWPPSPARLYHALVAGSAKGRELVEEDCHALAWLESLEAPIIAAPPVRTGQSFRNYVPNNDLDVVDPEQIGKIRAPKLVRPILFDAEMPLVYFWMFDERSETQNAAHVCQIAERLYQLGRGVDMAWAWGELLAADEVEARLVAHGGALHRPGRGSGGESLGVPVKGSLESLVERHKTMRGRFRTIYESKPTRKEPNRRVATGETFVQAPRPRFRQVMYDSPPARQLFDIVGENAAWPLDRIVELTERVRNEAARRLKDKRSDEADKIHGAIVGRRDANEADKSARVRIVPLPSIGHRHADRAIRRILLEIPPNCPLRADDVEWAFSGLLLVSEHGEIVGELAMSTEREMLAHYGAGDARPARAWRTITPAALPRRTARRRIDPERTRIEAKGGTERAEEENTAASAVVQALRHAGISARTSVVRVQREPFAANGARAEAFAPATRFAKEQLWHAQIEFSEAVRGPLVIGDGRYLGLGLLAPVKEASLEVAVFALPARVCVSIGDREHLLRAVRRALMALSRRPDGTVPVLFSGHEADGSPASSGHHRHVFLAAADLEGGGFVDRVIVAAPWSCDRSVQPGRGEAALFDRVVSSFTFLRAGRLGAFDLQIAGAESSLFGPSRSWESHTAYRPSRHAGRGKEAASALLHEIAVECGRRGLAKPSAEILQISVGPKGSVAARLRLQFAVAVPGPLLLGRNSHQGGGLFCISR
jgi:CRISPR-associated protein Csb2